MIVTLVNSHYRRNDVEMPALSMVILTQEDAANLVYAFDFKNGYGAKYLAQIFVMHWVSACCSATPQIDFTADLILAFLHEFDVQLEILRFLFGPDALIIPCNDLHVVANDLQFCWTTALVNPLPEVRVV